MKYFYQLYYWLTTYYPRLLPTSERRWDHMRHSLIHYYGVPDHLAIWVVVAGHVAAVPTSTVRRSYGYFANVAKRTLINKTMKEEQQKMTRVLNEQLERAAKETAAAMEQEETSTFATNTGRAQTDTLVAGGACENANTCLPVDPFQFKAKGNA